VPLPNFLRQKSSSSSSAKSDKSQLVDLVVEDHHAEEIDRVRARKEGGPGWNEVPSKHFVYVCIYLVSYTPLTRCLVTLTPAKAKRKKSEKASTQMSLNHTTQSLTTT
jgi:hypothetical protein